MESWYFVWQKDLIHVTLSDKNEVLGYVDIQIWISPKGGVAIHSQMNDIFFVALNIFYFLHLYG